MASRASRRGAKAQRRKKVLAERRKGVEPAGLAERIRRLAAAPLQSCLVQEGLFEDGLGSVLLARRSADGRLAMSIFLLDVFCLGVKDVVFRHEPPDFLEDLIAMQEDSAPLEPADPAYARRLLHEAVAFARSLGLEPHRDYAAAELLFGDVAAEACEASFQFGRDGKPLYLPGELDSPARVRRTLERLRRRLGEDGFDFAEVDDLGDYF